MPNNLEAKLYELQMLKQQYGITSTIAHVFMRCEATYHALKHQVNQALRSEGIQLDLSWQEISNLCEVIPLVISDALDQAHFVYAGQFHYFSVQGLNDDLLFFRKIPWAKYAPGTSGLCDRENPSKECTFQFDYIRFLQDFARAQRQGHDRQEAFRQAFLVFRDSAYPYLISPRDEHLSYKEFVDRVATYGKDIEEVTSEEAIAQTRQLIEELLEDFEEWQMTGSQSYYHARVKFNKVPPEERKFLYGIDTEDDPYERAMHEKTDKRLEIKRTIAFHYILGEYELIDNPAELLTKAVEDLTQKRDRRRETHKRLSELRGNSSIIEKVKISMDRTQYILTAIEKNRSWLEEMLRR